MVEKWRAIVAVIAPRSEFGLWAATDGQAGHNARREDALSAVARAGVARVLSLKTASPSVSGESNGESERRKEGEATLADRFCEHQRRLIPP